VIDLETLANQMASRPVSRLQRLDRWLQLLKAFRASQIARRARSLIHRRLRPQAVVGARQPPADLRLHQFTAQQQAAARIVLADYAGHLSHSQSRFTDGKLTLLNETKSVGWPIDWLRFEHDGSITHLWRFQLHYHEYLLSYLADDSSPRAWADCWRAIEHWIETYEPSKTSRWVDAWHPYCISRRIQVWLFLLALNPPAEPLKSELVNSLWQQALHLGENLELDLGGNHLMENLTALAMTSGLLDSPQSATWSKRVLQLLPAELDLQILPHGEHFERAPAYHCQVLGSLCRMSIFGPHEKCWTELRAAIQRNIGRMSQFLSGIIHGDGQIPLLSDSVLAESPSLSQLSRLADILEINWPDPSAGSNTLGPYQVVRNSENAFSIIVDTGEIAAPNLPAHGHADWMNLTATYQGVPWLVDSGNFDYEDSSRRRYCRSSLAHSVMTVDRENHCDLWSKFRMVRPGACIQRTTETIDGVVVVQATYDCYRKQFGCLLARCVLINPTGDLIVIDVADRLAAQQLIGYVHLAPQITLTRSSNGNCNFFASTEHERRQLLFFNCADVQPCQAWYSPAFGVCYSKTAVEYCSGAQSRPAWLAWSLSAQAPPCIQSLSLTEHVLRVHWGDWQSTISFGPELKLQHG
jgi:uncharacterized heparinase superfamily protein